ncbi:MAG: UDP-N-acetylglucosamine--N-acetylmuramyl-(pentapeptide) pyrophosphoryl-undecaprenol N-acetylglucosamine transferase, partial [Brevinema sp.]
MRIIIGGGGTGGHLIPGVALYQELSKNGHEVFYIMSERDKAYDISELLEHRLCVSLSGISRKISWTTVKQVYSIFQAWRLSYQTIKQFNPDIVVITGGYLSNIAALSALLMRKPLYILEQNSVAGITNRFWALFAEKIFTAIPSPKFIPSHKQIYTGNPLCFTQHLSVQEAKSILGLSLNQKPVLGISGGSQGAQKINDAVLSLIPQLMELGYQIVWSLGTKEFDRLNGQEILTHLSMYGDDLKMFRFINRMDAFWS